MPPLTSPELRLHAARDGIHAIIMRTLPWLVWQGGWALVLAALLAAEITLVVPAWWAAPTALSVSPPAIPQPLRWLLWAMAGGVLLSGSRDFYATCGMLYGAWPWGRVAQRPQETHT
jgi:hypothetical protein